jgi:hypothetical protein
MRNNEKSVPIARGRKGNLKDKRLSTKRVRRLPIDADLITLKRTQKSVILDK